MCQKHYQVSLILSALESTTSASVSVIHFYYCCVSGVFYGEEVIDLFQLFSTITLHVIRFPPLQCRTPYNCLSPSLAVIFFFVSFVSCHIRLQLYSHKQEVTLVTYGLVFYTDCQDCLNKHELCFYLTLVHKAIHSESLVL